MNRWTWLLVAGMCSSALAQLAPAPQVAGPRTGGRLTVNPGSVEQPENYAQRLRGQVSGSLSVNDDRTWTGPAVPPYVSLVEGTAELFLLDPAIGEGHLALYRDPYDASSCKLGGAANCLFIARLYGTDGTVKWTVTLNTLFSRADNLEVQDIRYAGGRLYFNEGCQSYSVEARRQCSALVAVDPVDKTVKWRTRNLTSNNRFLVLDDYILAGYGFTSEPDHVNLIRRADGKVVSTLKVKSAPAGYRKLAEDTFEVFLYDAAILKVRIDGVKGKTPKLVEVR